MRTCKIFPIIPVLPDKRTPGDLTTTQLLLKLIV